MPERPLARAGPHTLAADGALEWRPVQAEDRAFLRALFSETRAELIARLPVTGAARDLLIDLQMRAQEQAYRQQCAEVRFLVITLDGVPVGRLTLGQSVHEVQLTDLALLSCWQSRGIGTQLLRRVMAQAAAQGRCVRLSVATDNPAQRLYRRLGFAQVGTDAMYLHLRWPADRPDHPELARATAPPAQASVNEVQGESHAAT